MSKKNKKKHSEEEGGEAWLLPYSDLMTLLLAVFIVLFAVSKIDQTKANDIAQEFREGMMSGSESILSGEGASIIPENPDVIDNNAQSNENGSAADTTPEATQNPQENTDTTQEELEQFLGKEELGDLEKLKTKIDVVLKNENMSASVNVDMRGLVISLNNAVLFESGSAEIKNGNKATLYKMADIIRTLPNYIRIEGHTDNIPMKTASYPSNWELSTARAASVVRLFIEECSVSSDKLEAVGYGENRPIAENTTAEGRAKNRRIDIIILSEKYDNLQK